MGHGMCPVIENVLKVYGKALRAASYSSAAAADGGCCYQLLLPSVAMTVASLLMMPWVTPALYR